MRRRHFLLTIGAAPAAKAFFGFRSAPAVQETGRRIWIDERFHSMPRRPWRKIHLDFHNSQHVPVIGEKFDADRFGDALDEAHVDAVVVFAKDMHGYFYYPSEYGPVHPGLSFDLLGGQVEACRARDIAVYAYYCTTWDHHLAATHPEWLVIKEDGSNYLPGPDETPGWTALCLAHPPYRQLLAAHTTELVSNYALDGAWFDMAEPIAPACYCPECLRRMQAAGLDPQNADDQRRHKNDLFLDYHRQTTALVKRTRPGCQVDYNDIGLSKVSERAPYLDNIDIEALPTAFWGYFYAPAQIRYQRTFGIPVYGMTGRFQSAWADFGGLKTSTQLDVELASVVANAARCDIGDQMPPNGRLDPAVYHVIGESYKRIRDLEPHLDGAAPVTEAAVLVTDVAMDRMQGPDLYGIVKLLLEHRVQFDCVESVQPWERYGMLILPDERRIDSATESRLHKYISAGGNVLVCHHGGLRNDDTGAWLERYFMHYEGDSPYRPAYMKPLVPLADLVPAYEYALYDGASQWTCDRRIDSYALLGEPAFQRSAERYTSHRQTPFDHLTEYSVFARYRNVGLIGFPIGTSYHNTGYWIYRKAFGFMLERLMPVRLVDTSAPVSTEVTVTHQAATSGRSERYLVHLINWSSNRGSPEHPAFFEDPIPLTDVDLHLRLPVSIGAARCVVTGDDLTIRASVDGGIRVRVPRVEKSEIVLLEVG